jgi:hypothetical protein
MRLITTILGVVILSAMCAPAGAHELVGESWRSVHSVFANQNGCDNIVNASDLTGDCMLCHTDGGTSSDLNPYGLDIQEEHGDELWAVTIRRLDVDLDTDSDGDTIPNIIECREDCTFPGDAGSSVPVQKPSWSQLKALYE